jgi:allophanate hydrolase
VPRASQLDFFGDTDAADLYEQAVSRLERLGGTAIEFDYTPFDKVQRMLYEGPFLAERKAVVDQVVNGRVDELHPVTRAILDTAQEWTAVDVYRAIHELADLKRQARRIFEDFDVAMLPTTPTVYRTSDVLADPIRLNARLGIYTNFVNLLEMCGTAVPSGFRSDGMPLGITVLAQPFQDATAAKIANAAHRATGLPLGASSNAMPA